MTKRLKELILKRVAEENKGMDIDGDIVAVFDKFYYVDILNEKVMEVGVKE